MCLFGKINGNENQFNKISIVLNNVISLTRYIYKYYYKNDIN